MEIGIDFLLLFAINVTILIIGWWRFRVKLEVSMKQMEIMINQNATDILGCKNDIEMTRIEFAKEIKSVNRDIREDFKANAEEHKQMAIMLGRIEEKISNVSN